MELLFAPTGVASLVLADELAIKLQSSCLIPATTEMRNRGGFVKTLTVLPDGSSTLMQAWLDCLHHSCFVSFCLLPPTMETRQLKFGG